MRFCEFCKSSNNLQSVRDVNFGDINLCEKCNDKSIIEENYKKALKSQKIFDEIDQYIRSKLKFAESH